MEILYNNVKYINFLNIKNGSFFKIRSNKNNIYYKFNDSCYINLINFENIEYTVKYSKKNDLFVIPLNCTLEILSKKEYDNDQSLCVRDVINNKILVVNDKIYLNYLYQYNSYNEYTLINAIGSIFGHDTLNNVSFKCINFYTGNQEFVKLKNSFFGTNDFIFKINDNFSKKPTKFC